MPSNAYIRTCLNYKLHIAEGSKLKHEANNIYDKVT